VRACQRDDTEEIFRIVEDSGDPFALSSWLGFMVVESFSTEGMCLNHFLDSVAERTIEMINQHGKWGQVS
jgi:hypothetical protein